jgi:hypothetical protein
MKDIETITPNETKDGTDTTANEKAGGEAAKKKPIILKLEELADIFGGSRCPPRKA